MEEGHRGRPPYHLKKPIVIMEAGSHLLRQISHEGL